MIITANDIRKSFGHLEVLKGISLEVTEGEVLCIIGPSGSGKSTLLRCLNRLEEIQSGSITVIGENIVNAKNINKLRENIGMVFQSFNLFPNYTVMQNMMLAPLELKKMNRKEAEETAVALLRKVGLEDKKDVYPHTLSGGQKQRVAIARALQMNPKIMLFDEPTS
ncbi:MAG: glnQ1, partial [Firmicutes bacterium]|nr:glnQ1 [Bacillota bacterium]